MNLPSKLTPMMQQWHECKNQAKDALLFFRLGDFYEAFFEDANLISKELHLTLTKRQNVPMCGVPAHAAENYIDKLLLKGHKVAIAEQTEDPKQTKTLVNRAVIRIITPGTIINSQLLEEKKNNYFVSLSQLQMTFGMAIIDVTTGECRAIEVENSYNLLDELYRIRPAEVLISDKFQKHNESLISEIKQSLPLVFTIKEEWQYDYQMAFSCLTSHFHVATLDGFGLKGMTAAITASGALFSHLKNELHLSLNHVCQIHSDSLSGYMTIDYTCMKNMELTSSHFSSGKEFTLLYLLDHTQTPMGARLFHKWITHPLTDSQKIQERLDSVEELISSPDIFYQLQSSLSEIKDLERLLMKIFSGFASPRDLTVLRFSLEYVPILKTHLSSFSSSCLKKNSDLLIDVGFLVKKIEQTLVDEPPLRLSDGPVIRKGINSKLDELKEISQHSKQWIANYQNTLRESTGIKTLKVGFTQAFGYFIEVSKGQTEKMGETFHRRQTLVNGERYISDELKEFEQKVLCAEEEISKIESALFMQLKEEVTKHAKEISTIANAISEVDALFSLAYSAKKYNYVRPIIDDKDVLEILEGRHPVIEQTLPIGKFIPNDTIFDEEDHRLFLITGPNMAGKSTYIRQVALIVIMAQMGSFVPAKKAHIGIVDRLFSRIGASDDLTRGQSTFMVEMAETANILNNASSRSLVILDEIGRGTSTYDGISIAWAVAEYLLTTSNKHAKTLFATHYWELTEMEKTIRGAVNLQVAVSETDHGIVFLHKILKGGTDKSYGIHVAKLAGLPAKTIKRAEEMLLSLEKNNKKNLSKTESIKPPSDQQMFLLPTVSKENSFFEEEIKNLKIEELTPLEALQKLFDLKKRILAKK